MKYTQQFKLFLVGVSLMLGGCEGDYCSRLDSIVKDELVREYLVGWVDQNIKNQTNLKLYVNRGGGMGPGLYYVKKPKIDWKKLGLSTAGQVRILSEVPAYDDSYFEKITGVFFGERSGKGYLVKMMKESLFLQDSRYLKKVDERIMVLCVPRD